MLRPLPEAIAGLRPTGSKVREAIFDRLHLGLGGAVVAEPVLHAMNGPKKPPFATSLPPQSGHFSLASPDRSYASPMSESRSLSLSVRWKGVQKSPNACTQSISPSAILSSSSSICAVKPTLNTSGNFFTMTFSTVSPSGEGKKRRCSLET